MPQGTPQSPQAAQVTEPGGPVLVSPVEIRTPGPGEVRLDVLASGICGADAGTAAAPAPAGGFPITPGHEIAGVISELGKGVRGWEIGEHAAVGWFGGSCGTCMACRSGDVVHCPRRQTPGLSYPGGWASTITVPVNALVRIPDGLSMAEAAPFGCAGVTTFNALRHSGAEPGDRVAVLGIGGLGHLAVQFAAAMGFETIAISRGGDKRQIAKDLGAHHYVDTSQVNAGQALLELGGCRLILFTASSSKALAGLVDGLVPHGSLTVVGFDGTPLELPLDKLVMHARSVSGHVTGSPVDIEQAMRFALTSGVRPHVQTVPLEQVAEALETQQTGKGRFRMILTPAH